MVEEEELGSGGKGVHVAASEVVFAATMTAIDYQCSESRLMIDRAWIMYLCMRSLPGQWLPGARSRGKLLLQGQLSLLKPSWDLLSDH